MRVLFAAHGAYGHVMPLLGVARSLVENGHDVVVATSATFCPVVASAGLQPHPAEMDDGALVAEALQRWPDAASLPAAAWTWRMFCEIAAPAMAADLGPFLDRWRPDVVVREEGEHGSAVASAARGVPWVTHGWGSPLQDEDSSTNRAGSSPQCGIGPGWRCRRAPSSTAPPSSIRAHPPCTYERRP